MLFTKRNENWAWSQVNNYIVSLKAPRDAWNVGATSNHAHRLLWRIVKRELLKEVLYTKLILNLISFRADYTSGGGPVWDYTTIQLTLLAGNPVKMGNVGIKVSSAKRANSAHLITNAPEVIYSCKQSIPILATDTEKYFLHNDVINRNS